jgi:lysyl-tRNA synthetase class II
VHQAVVGLPRTVPFEHGEFRVALYLHTSPEFACKKLLAAGEPRLFSLGPVYRNREEKVVAPAVSAARRRSAAQSCIRLS